MLRKIIYANLLCLICFGFTAFAQEKTVINDAAAKRNLLGKHLFSLQWISWNHFGSATVTERNGVLYLKGSQKGRGNTDFVTIDGTVKEVNAKSFSFDGKIVIRVSHNNNGESCTRTGEMTFAITGKRRYWRLQEMQNPCEDIVDYVDIYLR